MAVNLKLTYKNNFSYRISVKTKTKRKKIQRIWLTRFYDVSL